MLATNECSLHYTAEPKVSDALHTQTYIRNCTSLRNSKQHMSAMRINTASTLLNKCPTLVAQAHPHTTSKPHFPWEKPHSPRTRSL